MILHRYSIRHPRRVLVGGALLMLALSPGLLRLKLRTDGHALVPTDDPRVRHDQAIRDDFQLRDSIAVIIRPTQTDHIYNPTTLQLVRDLTRDLSAIPGIDAADVLSLATECSDRVIPGTLDFVPLLDPMPETPADCARLRDDIRAFGVYSGTLVSHDHAATAVYIAVPPESNRTRLIQDLGAVLERRRNADHDVGLTGAPVAEALLGTHILQDLGVPSALLGPTVDRPDPESPAGSLTLPALRSFIGRTTGLLPLAIAVMFVIFVASFRSITAGLLPLIEVAACLIATFSLMGWFEVPIYLTMAVLPVILTAAGVTDEIHIFSRYRQELAANPREDHRLVLARTMDEMWPPVLKTTLTTAIGFLSFAFSPLAPVQAFGVFASLGMGICLLWSFTMIPAGLALMEPGRFKPSARSLSAAAPRSEIGWLARLGDMLIRRRAWVLLSAAAVLLATLFGIRLVRVQDSWIDNFSPESGFFKATQAFNDRFMGMHVLLVRADGTCSVQGGEIRGADVGDDSILMDEPAAADAGEWVDRWIELTNLDLPPPDDGRAGSARPFSARITAVTLENGRLRVTPDRQAGSPRHQIRAAADHRVGYSVLCRPFMLPDPLRRIEALERFLAGRTLDRVGGVLGPAAFLASANCISHARKETYRAVPDSPEKISWVWNWYERIRGADRTRQVMNADFSCGVISVFMKNANFVDTARLMTAIRDYEREKLGPHGIRLSFGGDVGVSQTLIGGIVRTEVASIGLSLLGTLATTILLTRSVTWGVCCVLPSLLALPATFAAMGWLGIPLGVATSMFAGMTLGMGVDFAIHLVDRFRLNRKRGMDAASALRDGLSLAGPPILVNALGVTVGFGLLVLSQVPANARLGVLFVVGMGTCLAATLGLLPVLLGWRSHSPADSKDCDNSRVGAPLSPHAEMPESAALAAPSFENLAAPAHGGPGAKQQATRRAT